MSLIVAEEFPVHLVTKNKLLLPSQILKQVILNSDRTAVFMDITTITYTDLTYIDRYHIYISIPYANQLFKHILSHPIWLNKFLSSSAFAEDFTPQTKTLDMLWFLSADIWATVRWEPTWATITSPSVFSNACTECTARLRDLSYKIMRQKIKYDQLIWFLRVPPFFSKLGNYFTIFMTNRKEGRRKTNQIQLI